MSDLRDLMRKAGIDAFLVPRGDEHRGEYVAAASERLKWLTAFSGSAGMAIVGSKAAALFVDGRYVVQAPLQTDTTLFKVLQIPTETPSAWLINTLKPGDVVGFSPWLHSIDEVEKLTSALKPHGIKLKAMPHNPIDQLWGAERPEPPSWPVQVQSLSRAGKSAADKISKLQETLKQADHDAVLLTMPDSICWLLNIRGSDVPHTPVVLSFAIIPQRGKVELFVDPARLGDAASTHLNPVAKLFKPSMLQARLAALKAADKKVRTSKTSAAEWFLRQLGQRSISYADDPCVKLKAIKNKVEIKGMRKAHQRDAIAMCRFLAWFDREAASGALDEITAAQSLEAFRHETNKLKEISFDTISGAGENGAVVHYRVNAESNRPIGKDELYLIDSGAQYLDGTTDAIEQYLYKSFGITVDFDLDDALSRLLKDGVATENRDGVISVLEPVAASAHIDAKWDSFLDDIPDLSANEEGSEFEGVPGGAVAGPEAKPKQMGLET